MNRDTRTFLWGLILLTVCGHYFSELMIELKTNINNISTLITWDFIKSRQGAKLITIVFGMFSGGHKIVKTTD